MTLVPRSWIQLASLALESRVLTIGLLEKSPDSRFYDCRCHYCHRNLQFPRTQRMGTTTWETAGKVTTVPSTDLKDHLSSWHPLDPPSGGTLNYVLNVISILPKVSKLQGTLTESQIVTSWKIHLLASIYSGWGWRGRKRIPNLLLAKSPEYIC